MCELLDGYDIVKCIEFKRMDNSTIPKKKKYWMGRFHGRRPVERRLLRWEDNTWGDCLVVVEYK
jgi:hypothetical protein